MGFGLILGFLQIQTRAECCTSATQHDDPLVWLIGSEFDRSYQLGEKLNGQRVTPFWAIQCDNRNLGRMFFSKNDGHGMISWVKGGANVALST
jgi:hypothetical protein